MQKKEKFWFNRNFINFKNQKGLILLLGLFALFSFSLFAQNEDDVVDEAMRDTKQQKESLLNAEKNILGKEKSKNIENDLDELPPEEAYIKKSVMQIYPSTDPKIVKKMKISEAVNLALTPLQKVSEADLLKQLLENTKGTRAHDFFVRFPKLILYVVRLLRDKQALSDATKILEDRKKLIRYSAIMISTFILGILLSRFFRSNKESILYSITLFFIRLGIMFSLRAYILIYFYGSELSRSFDIFKETFF
jgi:hypothetical protein